MNRRMFVAAAMLAGLSGVAAIAQTAPPTRVRGTIASLEGSTLTVNSRGGGKVDIALNDPLTVATLKKIELSAIAPGSYIGTATRTGADGKLTAMEVLVFPDAMRGAGEGHYPWDLEPGSMMTNGTVKGAVSAENGRELTVGYKDSAVSVFVPPDVPVVTFAPATREDLKPGAPVFIVAAKSAEGKLSSGRVTVGTNGVAPPM